MALHWKWETTFIGDDMADLLAAARIEFARFTDGDRLEDANTTMHVQPYTWKQDGTGNMLQVTSYRLEVTAEW